jgi:predicted GNAT family acetyltransferase
VLGDGLRDGSTLAAIGTCDGIAAGVAAVQMGGGSAELVGVATLPAFRRRGVATAVCATLLEAYFAGENSLCWLSAAAYAAPVYRRLGFVPIGNQLNYELRGAPQARAAP